jgi:hypothetical protein
MPSDYARRGRPRGSGLDDRVQLRRISDLLEANPSLRPTTAIKAIGVSDPSTIRRLREKLKVETPKREFHAAPSAPVQRVSQIEARSKTRTSTTPASSGAAMGEAIAPYEPQLSLFMQWCVLGLSAYSTTVEAQRAMFDDFLSVPPVASALRHQLLVNEVAKAFCPKRSDVRSTLH